VIHCHGRIGRVWMLKKGIMRTMSRVGNASSYEASHFGATTRTAKL